MLFNSIQFLVFLPIVFLVYWSLRNKLHWQNLFVVMAGYVFYGWWDWRFLLLIAVTTGSSFLSGVFLERAHKNRQCQKYISAGNIVLNLLILCIFKYFDFFSESLSDLFGQMGYTLDRVTLDILLPVGISFYTFQSIGYTIDVYRRKIKATKDVVAFFAFVCFFPQLVAGPIERSANLLPQFLQPRRFDYAQAIDGMRQILWGFFKKMVVADNCAVVVNMIFDDYQHLGSADLFLGAFLFAFQIYGDFSGYSDIAIGTGRLFGINLMRNFNYPYFAKNISDFWRRWHISLTTWFRDYIYIPLGGNRVSRSKLFLNTLIVFGISGIWHGANWTFVCWGLYHAFLFVPTFFVKSLRKNNDRMNNAGVLTAMGDISKMGMTFFLVMLGWVLFRSDSMADALSYLVRMFTQFQFGLPQHGKRLVFLVIFMCLAEWLQRDRAHVLQLERFSFFRYAVFRYILYYTLIMVIFNCSAEKADFIYFQF